MYLLVMSVICFSVALLIYFGYVRIGEPRVVQLLTGSYAVRRWDCGDWRFLAHDELTDHYCWRSEWLRHEWLLCDSKEDAESALAAYVAYRRFRSDIGRKVRLTND